MPHDPVIADRDPAPAVMPSRISRMMFRRLAQPQPQPVAVHEQSDDGLTWHFMVQYGLLFHNGERCARTASSPPLSQRSRLLRTPIEGCQAVVSLRPVES